ncbi:hypothetical protein ACC685_33445 [Rhizobium ruizarguesonis]
MTATPVKTAEIDHLESQIAAVAQALFALDLIADEFAGKSDAALDGAAFEAFNSAAERIDLARTHLRAARKAVADLAAARVSAELVAKVAA